VRSGPPAAPRDTGGILKNLHLLEAMPLIISEVAPARITMALSAAPEATSVALNPRASEAWRRKRHRPGNAKDRDDRRGPARYYAAESCR